MIDGISLMSIAGTFTELELGVKIILLLTIIGFVRSHVQNTLVATILIIIFSYLMLIQNWAWLGPFYVVYMLITFGAAGMFVDLFFIKQQTGEQAHAMEQQPGGGMESGPGLNMGYRR